MENKYEQKLTLDYLTMNREGRKSKSGPSCMLMKKLTGPLELMTNFTEDLEFSQQI